MSDTPLTDDIARGNHVVPTEFAQEIERENARLRDDKRRLDGLEAIPHQLEIVCKQSRPKSLGMPTLREQIDLFLANVRDQGPMAGRESNE